MTAYLLDTNHISPALPTESPLRMRLEASRRSGVRIGTCVPVICELKVGIRQTARRQRNENLLRYQLSWIRLWEIDLAVADRYAELHQRSRSKGRVLSQVDLMLAALAVERNLTLLTTDRDFEAFSELRCENWLDAGQP